MNGKMRVAIALLFTLALAGLAGNALSAESGDWQKAYDEYNKTVDTVGRQLDAKHAELAALMSNASPDKNRIQELYREIGDLKGQIVAADVGLRGQAGPAPMAQGGYGMHHGGEFGYGGMGYGGGRGHRGSMGHGGGHHGGW